MGLTQFATAQWDDGWLMARQATRRRFLLDVSRA